MNILNILKCTGTTNRCIAVVLCIAFIVTSVFVLLSGFINPTFWSKMYAMDDTPQSAIIIVYIFVSALLVNCVFLLIALKQENRREILLWLLVSLALWQFHLIVCFVALVFHIIKIKRHFKAGYAFLTSLPLLCAQGLWLYLISVLWYYWRELSSQPDVPTYIRSLLLKRARQKAVRQDQLERLGNLPKRFLDSLLPPTTGISAANAL